MWMGTIKKKRPTTCKAANQKCIPLYRVSFQITFIQLLHCTWHTLISHFLKIFSSIQEYSWPCIVHWCNAKCKENSLHAQVWESLHCFIWWKSPLPVYMYFSSALKASGRTWVKRKSGTAFQKARASLEIPMNLEWDLDPPKCEWTLLHTAASTALQEGNIHLGSCGCSVKV